MKKLLVSFAIVAIVCVSNVPAQPPLLPHDLPGVQGGSGTVGVTDYRGGLGSLEDLQSVSDLIEQIKSDDLVPDVTASEQYAFTDVADLLTNSAGGPILEGPPFSFPSDTPANDDHFISIAKGAVMIPESGTYTIQVRSDEGMGFRMVDTPFISVHGNGRLESDGSMIHPEATFDADTRGVIALAAGRHEFEFLMWEHEGGAYWEISSARGAHPQVNTTRWLALGDETTLPRMGGAPPVATLVGNAQVVNLSEEDGGWAGDIEIARDLIRDAREHGDGTVRDDVATIVMDDHDGPSRSRPGAWVAGQGDSFRWPLNHPPSGGDAATDFNNFSSGLFGQLRVDDGDDITDETLLLTFAMFSSDGSQFHIAGQSFTRANKPGLLSHAINRDTALTHPDPTAIAEAFGLIELQEGIVHDWEGFHYENGRDAGYEIWVALGDQLDLDAADTERFLATFFPLSNTLQSVSVVGNQGLALVEPSASVPGDYNNNRQLDLEDLDLQAGEIAGQTHDPGYDLNDDSLVDYGDRLFWVEQLKKTFIGDANLDGEFNSSDFVQVFVAGKYETSQTVGWGEGDWNADLVFDSSDFVAAFVGGGYELGLRSDALNSVPEPSGVMLVLLGLVGFLFLPQRRGGAE